MADKNIFKLEGKSQEQVKEALSGISENRQNQARWLCQRRLKQGYLQGSERGLRGKLGIGNQESRGCHRSKQTPDRQNRRRT